MQSMRSKEDPPGIVSSQQPERLLPARSRRSRYTYNHRVVKKIHNLKKPTVSLLLAIILCGNSTAIAFDETDVKKLEVLNVCEECDLSGARLKGAILRYADLSGADLSGADLSGANLKGAVLRYTDLTGADLTGADLGGANLRWADLRDANLRDANLRGAKLGDAIICKTLMPWGEDNSGCK